MGSLLFASSRFPRWGVRSIGLHFSLFGHPTPATQRQSSLNQKLQPAPGLVANLLRIPAISVAESDQSECLIHDFVAVAIRSIEGHLSSSISVQLRTLSKITWETLDFAGHMTKYVKMIQTQQVQNRAAKSKCRFTVRLFMIATWSNPTRLVTSGCPWNGYDWLFANGWQPRTFLRQQSSHFASDSQSRHEFFKVNLCYI